MTTRRLRFALAAAAAGFALALGARAQDKDAKDPAKAAQEAQDARAKAVNSGQAPDGGAPTTPAPKKPLPPINDADVAAAAGLFTGTWVSTVQGTGDAPAGVPPLRLSMARVDVAGLDNAQYFEVSRADGLETPFRQCLLHVYKRDSELRLRIFDFANPRQGLALVGLWLAPEAFPSLSVANLTVNADLPLRKEGDGYTGATGARIPTTQHDAWEFESSITISRDALSLSDKGFDRAGRQVYGDSAPGTQRAALAFKHFTPTSKVQTGEQGLVMIDLVPPKEGELALKDGMSGLVNFTGWTMDGTLVGTSRQEGGRPQPFTIPGRMIRGWLLGMPGMTKGGHRRLIVPPALAFGESGSPDGRIPKNAWLAFEIELVHLEQAGAPTPPNSGTVSPEK